MINVNLDELLRIYTSKDVDDFLFTKIGLDPNEKRQRYEDISKQWLYVGDNPNNAAIINSLKDPEKGVIERITNAIDAVLEKEKERHKISSASSPDVILKKAFPKYYKHRCDIILGKETKSQALDASDKIVVVMNDGSQSNKPTIDVIDLGTGINGVNFRKTILSINGSNKLSTDKNYLIGTFGQGGSTSFPFTYATIIISKYEGKYYFTIVRKFELEGHKNFAYLYLSYENSVIELLHDEKPLSIDYMNKFIESDSGTIIRMVETEIPREYRVNDAVKPGMLGDLINTELFRVALPIKLIENRSNFLENKNAQSRNAFGSYIKMHTWKYMRKDISGSVAIEHNNNPYSIDYYIILPEDEDKWASDQECKEIFKQINVHLDPIIYIVNGQYITGEYFTRLKNNGLSFLQYRMLVVINLDVLGNDKYQFFTSDRSQIKNTDLTKGFIDKVISVLCNEEKIIEVNRIIMDKSVSTKVDGNFLKEISESVKDIYNKFLISNNMLFPVGSRNPSTPDDEEIYLDFIKYLIISNVKNTFLHNEKINIILETRARKSINREATIDCYLNDKAYVDHVKSVMNGRIQYSLSMVAPGNHKIQFDLFSENKVVDNSNIFEFQVLEIDKTNEGKSETDKVVNLTIESVKEKEFIVEVIRNENEKSIHVYYCLDHEILSSVYGKLNADLITSFKNSLLQPMILYVLLLNDNYDSITDIEKRNEILLAFIKTQFFLYMKN